MDRILAARNWLMQVLYWIAHPFGKKQPEPIVEKVWPARYQTLLNVLPTESKWAIKSAHLVARLGMTPTGPTQEGMRSMIRQAILEYQLPIGSCTDGYYLISTELEAETNDNYLAARIAGIEARRKATRAGWDQRVLDPDWPPTQDPETFVEVTDPNSVLGMFGIPNTEEPT
jgi:hypothetical protein